MKHRFPLLTLGCTLASWSMLVPTVLVAAPPTAAPEEDRRTVEDTSKGKPTDTSLDTGPIAAGPFTPDFPSLKAYRCPEWYQDAKFGMWAHWGPQGVPEIGDWYARNMYIEGKGNYKYHLAHYGHPSVFGFKDIIALWKADKFDPDRLINLYKKAGAKYFVSMACHHDNFDLWNSKFHHWNAVEKGPHKDIVGLWRDATLKQGLRFGVSEHMAPSYKWFSVAHNADKEGPLAGVPYDANDPQYYELYGPKPEKLWGDGGELWSETGMPDSWKLEWFKRVRDVLDNYQPDYVYSDYGNVPFRREVGWKLLANYYNKSIADHGGKLEAVYTGKGDTERAYVRDFESGAAGDVQAEPWQMDWCINSFFYYKDTKDRPYRKADAVIRLLTDVVSKNGNLLLSIPQRPDGTIDDEEEKILADLAAWMEVNGEAIFKTRPFKIFGRGHDRHQRFSREDPALHAGGRPLHGQGRHPLRHDAWRAAGHRHGQGVAGRFTPRAGRDHGHPAARFHEKTHLDTRRGKYGHQATSGKAKRHRPRLQDRRFAGPGVDPKNRGGRHHRPKLTATRHRRRRTPAPAGFVYINRSVACVWGKFPTLRGEDFPTPRD